MAKKWIEEARKACDGNCVYCEYYWQEWDESGCKLDDFESEDSDKEKNNLRTIKEGEGSCLDCEWGGDLLGGGKGATCLHAHKKNISELKRCDLWEKRK